MSQSVSGEHWWALNRVGAVEMWFGINVSSERPHLGLQPPSPSHEVDPIASSFHSYRAPK